MRLIRAHRHSGGESSKRVQAGEANLLLIEDTALSRRGLASPFVSGSNPAWAYGWEQTPPKALLMAHHACDPGRRGDYTRSYAFNPTLRRTSKAGGPGDIL